MKRIFLIMAVLAMLFATSRAQSVKRFSVQNIEMQVGEVAELVINLSNCKSMTSVQFNLTLPEGISFDTSTVQLGMATDGHTLNIEPLPSGSYWFLLYSKNQKAFMDGEILRIPLTTGSEALSSEGRLSKVRTATFDAVSYICPDVTFTITVNETATDIRKVPSPSNKDGHSDVFDLNGRRVTNPAQGISIIDGKKVLLK